MVEMKILRLTAFCANYLGENACGDKTHGCYGDKESVRQSCSHGRGKCLQLCLQFQEIIHRPVSRSKSRGRANHCKTGWCSYFQTFAKKDCFHYTFFRV